MVLAIDVLVPLAFLLGARSTTKAKKRKRVQVSMLGLKRALSIAEERLSATEARADLGIRFTTGQELRRSANFEWRVDVIRLAGGAVGCNRCLCCESCELGEISADLQFRQCQTGSDCASFFLRPAHDVCHLVSHAEQTMAAFLVDELVQPPQVLC